VVCGGFGYAASMTHQKLTGGIVPPSDPAAVLLHWIKINPKAPSDWRGLATVLASHDEMPAVWKSLSKHGDIAMRLFSAVNHSLDRAHSEIARQTATEEAEQLARVRKLAVGLKEAIEHSPLPRNWSVPHQIFEDDGQSVVISIGWRDMQGGHMGPRLAVVDVLDLVAQLVDSHIKSLPPRAVVRHRAHPLTAAFVRWLTWNMTREVGSASPQTVARIANAVLDLARTVPLDKESVKQILKDTPPAFQT